MASRTALISAGLLALAAALPADRIQADEVRSLTIATGRIGGVYQPLGEGMAHAWSRAIPGLDVAAEATYGSIVNMLLLQSHVAELALVQNDIASYAYRGGEELFGLPAPAERARGVAVLYPEAIQVVTLRGSGIASIEDLPGRRVAVGEIGSGTEVNARQVMEVHGFGFDDIAEYPLPFANAAVALQNGLVDAAFVTGGVPTDAVDRLPTSYGYDIALVPIDPGKIEELVERWPYYEATVIPGGTYAGVDEDVPTVTVLAMLVADADLDPGLVERMLEVLYSQETLDLLCTTHVRACDLAPDAGAAASPIPLHPGAERFFARHLGEVPTQ